MMKVTRQGFATYNKTDLTVSANNVTRVDVQMKIGNVADSVSVAADATALQTETASIRGELSGKEISNLPISAYRNYQSLLNLVPGTTPGMFQNANTDTPARALATNVNGTANNNNNTRLDGAANIFIWLPQHAVYVAPAETVQQVSISTNSFDAEQGLAGGAAVSVITKSGTNDLHGVGFIYHDNTLFRAKNFFQPVQLGKNTPKFLRNITGGTLGGPIKRDKLFFFGSYEGTFERTIRDRRLTVPTDDQRAGNFNAYNTKIFDPLTGSADGSGRTQFANNTIPDSRISPVAKKLLALIPRPNLIDPATGKFPTTSNYYSSGPQIFDRHNMDGKINWNRTASHQIWGKYSFMEADVSGQFSLGEAGGPCLCDGGNGTGNTKVNVVTVGQTYTTSSNWVIDGNFGFTRMDQTVKGPDFGQNFGADALGIPGTNDKNDIRTSGKPIFDITGYTQLGNVNSWSPIFREDQSFTGSINASKLHGAHEFRFGFDLIRHELNHFQPEIGGGPRGQFSFREGATSDLSFSIPSGQAQFNAFAAFLLGLPFSMEKSLQYELMTAREWQSGFYFRDRWQVTRNLTATLGLRYELFPLMHRADRGIERIDFASSTGSDLKVLLGGRGGNPDDLGVTTSKKLFAPRIGLAYRLGNQMVIRAGYGLTYDPIPFGRPLRGFFPLTIAQTFQAPNTRQFFRPIEQGIPLFTGPDLSQGVAVLPTTVDMRSPYKGEVHRGYIQSWNLSVERKLLADLTASVGYVGTQTTNQLGDLDINAAEPGGGNTGRPLFAQYGRTAPTRLWDGFLSANYHALQVAVNRRFARGLFLKGAYTFSKAINMTDETGWTLGFLFYAPSALKRNRALAGYDVPHNFQLAVAYELPFGKGKGRATEGAAAALFGGWQVSGIFSAISGPPFTVTASGTTLNAPGNTQVADQVKPEVKKLGGIGPGQPYYDPTAFAPVNEVRFGNTGRNFLRGPEFINLNLTLQRRFMLTERLKLDFKAEGYNFTNTPHFANPAANASAGNFMIITGTRANILEDQRQFRFGLRLEF